MKNSIILLCLLFFGIAISAQYPKGKIVVDRLYSEFLENEGGEDPTRRVTTYLPAGYDDDTKRYPVLYYLHGFTWSDSLQIAWDKFDKILDKAIGTGKIKPVIVVMSDQYTLYRGSFYTNSSLTGNWSDFTAIDLVNYADNKFRTIPKRESRGIVGHSMGGSGAIKVAMLYPDRFSCVYGISPAVMGFVNSWGPSYTGHKKLQEIKTREELITGYAEFDANALVAIGRAFSPNKENPPFYADLPYTYKGDDIVIHHEVIQKWKENMPLHMLDNVKYSDNLKKLKAIKFDWGWSEEFRYVPEGCRAFSEKLELLGIDHYAEEYNGKHFDKLWSIEDGRAISDILPFFDANLEYE